MEEDKYVLYVGTPCQIAGLKSFLKVEYSKLCTCDIVCHGVPSPKMLRKYVKYREEKDEGKAKKIYFRNKSYGWKQYAIKIEYENGKQYLEKGANDPYIRLFGGNFILRKSCFNCSFKGANRYGDITLGDFWGIEGKYPELDDNKGTSLILINSSKGQELWDQVKTNFYYKEDCDLEYAIQNNSCIVKSVNCNQMRDKVLQDMDNMDFEKLCKKYIPKPTIFSRGLKFLSIVKRKLRNIILKK